MANTIVRAAVVRVGSKKVAEAHSADLSVPSGDEATFGAEGYLGHTQGAVTSKITMKAIMPVAGMSTDLPSLVISKKRVSLTYFAGGNEYQIANAACTQFDLTSETKSGMLEGTFTFEGGLPTRV